MNAVTLVRALRRDSINHASAPWTVGGAPEIGVSVWRLSTGAVALVPSLGPSPAEPRAVDGNDPRACPPDWNTF
jgi:hypothetical protein